MGRLLIEGKNSKEVLEKLTTNSVEKLYPGRVQYTLITNEKGGVKDDATLYMISEEKFLLCVNAANKDKIKSWFERWIPVKDLTEETVQIAVQGKESADILKRFYDVADIKFYHFKVFGETIVSRTGYTGEKGFEIYTPVEEGIRLFEKLLKEVQPCGIGSRDVLRIEAGFPLYGSELSEEITPLEAGLERFVDTRKDFIGKDAMLSKKIERKLTGVEMVEKGVPRKGYKVFHSGEIAGEISSGTFSPTLNKGIGMAFLKLELLEEGTEVEVEVRGKPLKAKVRSLPFYRGGK